MVTAVLLLLVSFCMWFYGHATLRVAGAHITVNAASWLVDHSSHWVMAGLDRLGRASPKLGWCVFSHFCSHGQSQNLWIYLSMDGVNVFKLCGYMKTVVTLKLPWKAMQHKLTPSPGLAVLWLFCHTVCVVSNSVAVDRIVSDTEHSTLFLPLDYDITNVFVSFYTCHTLLCTYCITSLPDHCRLVT